MNQTYFEWYEFDVNVVRIEAILSAEKQRKIFISSCGKNGHYQRNCKAQRRRITSASPPRERAQTTHQKSLLCPFN